METVGQTEPPAPTLVRLVPSWKKQSRESPMMNVYRDPSTAYSVWPC